ncbi:hypothetical protein [Streptomyces sp. Y7]|uniref:hypothetical protein n=1 Tax=Streptomyces sp. Y7 TaxID=3342392 RepID=UPI00370F8039
MFSDKGDGVVVLSNEFATARLSIDRDANGVRLSVEDPRSGAKLYLDPFELQCLAYLTASDLAEFMKPSFQEEYSERYAPDSSDGPSVQ